MHWLLSQAALKSSLDQSLTKLNQKIERAIIDATREMRFRIAMDSAVLRREQKGDINALINGLRTDRELCNRHAINTCRRRVGHVLQPDITDDRCYRRWSRH
jgi:hypothetical protein